MITKVSADTFHNDVYHHDGPVVVTFGYTGCGPCRSLQPSLEKLAETGVKVVKVDIVDDPDIATHFGISSVPTTLFFARGEPRLSFNGVANVKKLQALLAEAVADGEKSPADHAHA
jgi:thioredoxin 1